MVNSVFDQTYIAHNEKYMPNFFFKCVALKAPEEYNNLVSFIFLFYVGRKMPHGTFDRKLGTYE